MALGKTILIAGLVILIVGVALFFIGGFMGASSLKQLEANLVSATPLTLSSNSSISLGTPSKLTLLIYNTSLGKPLKIVQNINGTNASVSQLPENGYIAAILSPKYEAFMINNYSVPITLKYTMSEAVVSSLLNVAIYTGLGFFLGIVGLIVVIVGVVLYFRSRKR